MSPNPYEPPSFYTSQKDGYSPPARPARTLFVLAGIGALGASLYWAALTLLLGMNDDVSPIRMILPIVLIGLYAMRGFQSFKGNPTALDSLLWLHGIGALMAVMNLGSEVAVLYGIKLAIHVFGAITAFLAQRACQENVSRGLAM